MCSGCGKRVQFGEYTSTGCPTSFPQVVLPSLWLRLSLLKHANSRHHPRGCECGLRCVRVTGHLDGRLLQPLALVKRPTTSYEFVKSCPFLAIYADSWEIVGLFRSKVGAAVSDEVRGLYSQVCFAFDDHCHK